MFHNDNPRSLFYSTIIPCFVGFLNIFAKIFLKKFSLFEHMVILKRNLLCSLDDYVQWQALHPEYLR